MPRGKAVAWKRRSCVGSQLLLTWAVGLGANTDARLADESARAECGRCVESYDAKCTTDAPSLDARADSIRTRTKLYLHSSRSVRSGAVSESEAVRFSSC